MTAKKPSKWRKEALERIKDAHYDDTGHPFEGNCCYECVKMAFDEAEEHFKENPNPFQQDVQDANKRLGKEVSRLQAERKELKRSMEMLIERVEELMKERTEASKAIGSIISKIDERMKERRKGA
jgi:predicted RNase H-like nuclease (RuvC/YqgF family)